MTGKKKKKPAANPARGFATTSLPSKPKVVSDVDEQPLIPSQDESSELNEVEGTDGRAESHRQKASNEKNVENMTPTELEQHLEHSELQHLVDAHAARVKSDAAKQLSKLENERRQLRQLADRASMSELTEELREEILSAPLSALSRIAVEDRIRATKLTGEEDDLLLKLWTLREVLIRLQMPSVDDALAHVLTLFYQGNTSSTDDSLPGLSDILMWYALTQDSTELPDYETGKVKSASTEEEILEELDPELVVTNEKKDEGQDAAKPSMLTVGPQMPEDAESSDADALDSDQELDDPDQLIDRWIDLQISKFKLGQRTGRRTTNQEAKQKKIDQLISNIERDMLFDADAARQRWEPHLKDMQIEAGQARKQTKRDKEPHVKTKTSLESSEDASDVDEMLSGMFGDEEASAEQILTTNEAVIMRDFGTWSGVHPRRLLEEAAPNLARSGIKFHSLLTTSFSSRLQLGIAWKSKVTVDELSCSCLPHGVEFQLGRSPWLLKMQYVATKNNVQSEAFLATLALFLLHSSGIVNSKVLQRLPRPFRNLVSDLEQIRIGVVRDNDINIVQHIRRIMRSTTDKALSDPVDSVKLEAQGASVKHSSLNHFIKHSPDFAMKSWAQRADTVSYKKMQQGRRDLPIYNYKQEILHAFEQNQILIVCADTGAGKSTQVPSYILEHHLSNGTDVNILVTQPRRISAISIARRVSSELGEGKDDLGTARSLIGYAIRLESKTSSSTRITFATTGVLLRMLQDSADLDHLDCLVLDEVHERTMDLDLLFIALKRLRRRRSTLKIVLMSATVNAGKFSSYFDNAPVLDIPGRTFLVEVGFLEDAVEETLDIQVGSHRTINGSETPDAAPDSDEADTSEGESLGLDKYSSSTRRVLAQYDHLRIDYDLIVKLATAIATKPKFFQYSSAILIFMPGIGEIRRLYNLLVTSRDFSSGWVMHMLHSSFSIQELEQAFAIPQTGMRKIVIATNIAETGITIPDVTAVIDTCKEKVMRFDERRQLSRLTEGLIARASARQRRGRAARVREGLCFHLVTRHRFEQKMPEQAAPEMLRLSLQDPILRVKIWNLGPAEEVLAAAIDPPSSKNVRRALMKLQDAGAIDTKERLTPLGGLLAKLPLDVALGKMAVFGVMFQCLDAIITIVASFSIKSIFAEKGTPSASTYAPFARGDSDFLTTYNAYAGWKKASKAGSGQQFCQKNHLSQFQLHQLEEQKTQLLINLTEAGLVSLNSEENAALRHARNSRSRSSFFEVPACYDTLTSDTMVAATIAMALYPRILKREGQGYRNVYTNQQLQLASTSINRITGKPPPWLVYLEATQARNGRLNAFHSSRITQAILALLLGEADFKFYAGVVEVDNGRVRFSLRHWKEMLAFQQLRFQVKRVIGDFLMRPQMPLQVTDQQWLDLMTIALDGPSQSRVY